MSLAVLSSRALVGVEAPPVRVETHLASGLPSFTVVGLADMEVRERPALGRMNETLANLECSSVGMV
jgi:predicted ATPase with chaperone activity